MTQLLIDAPGFEVVSVSEPYADRGASVLVRVSWRSGSMHRPCTSAAPPAHPLAEAATEPSRQESGEQNW